MRFRSFLLTIFEDGLRQQPDLNQGLLQQVGEMRGIVTDQVGGVMQIHCKILPRLLTNAFLRLPEGIQEQFPDLNLTAEPGVDNRFPQAAVIAGQVVSSLSFLECLAQWNAAEGAPVKQSVPLNNLNNINNIDQVVVAALQAGLFGANNQLNQPNMALPNVNPGVNQQNNNDDPDPNQGGNNIQLGSG